MNQAEDKDPYRILKGDICYTPEPGILVAKENAYLAARGNTVLGVYDEIPNILKGAEVTDCTGMLIMPGLTDLHTHAPQHTFYGTGMDYELLEWLAYNTFPEEARYADPEYAEKAYGYFSECMKNGATTRAVIYGTIHRESTLMLMECMEKSGLVSYVGKVNMDRNSPDDLTEEGASSAAEDTRRFIEESCQKGFERTKPIITPRFAPSCSGELMRQLGRLREQYSLPVQSHLSENPDEVALVHKLFPEAEFYGDVYDRYGLFGKAGNTVMAHCIYSTEEEVQRMRRNGVFVAHCPSSNMNLASGIAPIRSYLTRGLHVGLGTDVAGGSSLSMFRAVTDAIQVSKLYWRYMDETARPLLFRESFYMGTKGGGAFFGKCGSFEEGYAFDAVVIDDRIPDCPSTLSLEKRLERAFYMEMDRDRIVMKIADGRPLICRI